MEKINDAEANRKKFIKINESLDNDFVSCVKKVKFEKDMTQASSLIPKANTLKWQSKEWKHNDKKLDETIYMLNWYIKQDIFFLS